MPTSMQSIGAGEPTSLAVQQHDKEMARTVAMRDRMEARRDRFFNARNRTIGVRPFQGENIPCRT